MEAGASIADHFRSIKEWRVLRGRLHVLLDIIVLCICAVIADADTIVDIEEFGKDKEEWLRGFLELPHGIPSHDTIGRVLSMIDPDEFQRCFLSWIQSVAQVTAGQVIAIDGKTLRGSSNKETNCAPIHMVSAWATANQLVLAQLKVDVKSNEITAIPKLLNLLAVSGCILTLDAMGTQKEIAAQIIEKEADYVLALKENHPTMYQEVECLFEQGLQQNSASIQFDYYKTEARGHGRVEVREYWTTSDIDILSQKESWKGLQSVAMVKSERYLDGESSFETKFYLSSLASNAELIGTAIRTHWGIENQVHWVLDVVFHEDGSRVRTDYAPQNLALIRHIALNLLKHRLYPD